MDSTANAAAAEHQEATSAPLEDATAEGKKSESAWEEELSEAESATREAAAKDAKAQGNGLYQQQQWEAAAEQYSIALEQIPHQRKFDADKAIFLGNRGACFLKLEQYDKVVEDSTAALDLNPSYVKVLLRRCQAYEHLGQPDKGIADAQAVLEIDPALPLARELHSRLEVQLKEKQEKEKEEMMGNLKKLGNQVLGHFGMSLDNFKATKDPGSGSYNISFQQGGK